MPLKTARPLLYGIATLLLSCNIAMAHAHLNRASPADRAEESTSPGAITLTFTEDIEIALSSIQLSAEAGRVISTGKAHYVDGNRKSLQVVLPQLEPGIYKVAWKVTSVDTHHSEGGYTFTVK